eukprot:CAMPEP_0172673702 /NCGR_PEP_ID=MMETSP1074-20121228/12308_1 /TAXON_ID=2916 /ORGANISM="Ceratium fusus, Strain PA161109" /LENGTH=35 /DNA_ID= /DNA_START= /DNA_END= /DNA_ORIENTATION=
MKVQPSDTDRKLTVNALPHGTRAHQRLVGGEAIAK